MKAYLFIIFVSLVDFSLVEANDVMPISVNIHSDNLNDYNEMRDKGVSKSGITSASNNLVFSRLNVDLSFDYMTLDRSKYFMKKNQNICVTDRIKTKSREKNFIFTKPVNLFLGRRLYQNLNNDELQIELSPNIGAVDLNTLFKSYPKKTILLSKQVSYGEDLDQVLKTIPEKNKVYRNGAAHDTGVLHMFAKGRVNYSLFFPQQLFEYGIDIHARSYEIYGVKPYVTGALMCTNNEAMRKFVKQVNKALDELYKSGELLNLHLNYLAPNDKSAFIHHFLKATQVN